MSDKNPVPMIPDPVIAEMLRHDRPPEDFEYTGYDFPGGTIEPKDPNDPVQVEAALKCAEMMRTPEKQAELRSHIREALDKVIEADFYGSAIFDTGDDGL